MLTVLLSLALSDPAGLSARDFNARTDTHRRLDNPAGALLLAMYPPAGPEAGWRARRIVTRWAEPWRAAVVKAVIITYGYEVMAADPRTWTAEIDRYSLFSHLTYWGQTFGAAQYMYDLPPYQPDRDGAHVIRTVIETIKGANE